MCQLPISRKIFYLEPWLVTTCQDLKKISYQATHSYHTLLRAKENSRNQGTNHPHNKPRPDMNTDNMSPLEHSNADKEGLENYNIAK